jgi:MerR family transcriptional regulator, Zn(II)-responsive regulator of zntA
MVYSISDLAIEAGLSYDTVYYYIREELISESLRVGNRQRIFGEDDLDMLKRIVSLRKEGKSIEAIRHILQEEAANV